MKVSGYLSRYLPLINHVENKKHSFFCFYILFISVDLFKRFSGKSQINMMNNGLTSAIRIYQK